MPDMLVHIQGDKIYQVMDDPHGKDSFLPIKSLWTLEDLARAMMVDNREAEWKTVEARVPDISLL
jgi:hypothetical protein